MTTTTTLLEGQRQPYADPNQVGPNGWLIPAPNWNEPYRMPPEDMTVEWLAERLRNFIPENDEEAESKARLMRSDFFKEKPERDKVKATRAIRSDDV